MKRRNIIIVIVLTIFLLIPSNGLSQEVVADMSFSGKVVLLNPESTLSAFDGKALLVNEDKEDIPFIRVSNGFEAAHLFVFPGDVVNSVSRIKVYKAAPADDATIVDWSFYSEHGARLGMTKEEILSIYGEPTKNHFSEGRLMVYYIAPFNYFLEEYNMPLYSEVFVFEDNHLVSMEFGFDYP